MKKAINHGVWLTTPLLRGYRHIPDGGGGLDLTLNSCASSSVLHWSCDSESKGISEISSVKSLLAGATKISYNQAQT